MLGYSTADPTSAEGTSYVSSVIKCLWYSTSRRSYQQISGLLIKAPTKVDHCPMRGAPSDTQRDMDTMVALLYPNG